MYNSKKFAFVRLLAMIMVLAMLIPVGASAAAPEAIQPRASYYLDSYNAYVYLPGGSQVQVWFDVEGTGMMDEIGVLSIELYESTDRSNWTWVKTFKHTSTSGMLAYGDYSHSGHVTYNSGVAGRYYKAYVCVWAGKNGSGDTRYFWTSVKP